MERKQEFLASVGLALSWSTIVVELGRAKSCMSTILARKVAGELIKKQHEDAKGKNAVSVDRASDLARDAFETLSE